MPSMTPVWVGIGVQKNAVSVITERSKMEKSTFQKPADATYNEWSHFLMEVKTLKQNMDLALAWKFFKAGIKSTKIEFTESGVVLVRK